MKLPVSTDVAVRGGTAPSRLQLGSEKPVSTHLLHLAAGMGAGHAQALSFVIS